MKKNVSTQHVVLDSIVLFLTMTRAIIEQIETIGRKLKYKRLNLITGK